MYKFQINRLLILLSFSILLSCQNSLKQKNYPENLTTEELEKVSPINHIEPIEVRSLEGNKFTIGKGSQKPTLLIFFATWCPACKVTLPIIEKAYKGNTDVNIIAVGREHTTEELKKWKETFPLSFDLVADEKREIYGKFADKYIPRLYVIDTEGNITFQDIGWKDYTQQSIDGAIYLPAQ